ncbi:MAG: 2-hydroxyacyl-CoA dehydratase family protein, partial [Bradyrhizobium sp.]
MNSESAVRNAIQGVIDLHRDRLDLLRAAKEPKVGFVSIQTPEEILLAAGVIPFRITGELEDSSDAGARLNNNYCSYILSCLGEGLDGIYDFADGVVFTNGCDMRKRLCEAWARDIPAIRSYFLDLPGDASDLSKTYFARQLRKLIAMLEQRFGREVDDHALRGAIDTCNRSRAAMQRLDRYLREGRTVLSGEQMIQVVKAASTGLKEPFIARMSVLLGALEVEEQRAPRKRHRVMICGSYFDHKGIIDTIEETGAELVCADISNGVKYFEGNIDPDGDPVAAIASYYLEKHTSA